jgi:adenine-specific DNA-methyltransferase
MATGIPRVHRSAGSDGMSVELSFPGKRPLSAILEAQPALLTPVRTRCGLNRLYFAENLHVLTALAVDKDVCGKVRLVYIDPPYATQADFHSRSLTHAYEDVFSVVEHIDFLRDRLAFLHRLLADDGSIYVHIDDRMLFHTKLVMDEIFGRENYRNCITRRKCNPKNYTRRVFGNVADYILFYTKSDRYVWNRQVEPWTDERAKEYQYVEPETGRRFMKVPVHAPGTRNGETGKPWRGNLPPPGKHWQFPPAVLDAMDARGEIFWSKNGNPRRKVYLDRSAGIPVQDIWTQFRDAHNQNVHITGYPTEKNLDLLKRIVEASSNPGDLVLDCFAGSGTTIAAADTLGRSWIGIDNSPEALRTMLHRFTYGVKPMGDFVGERAERRAIAPGLFDTAEEAETDHSTISKVRGFSLLTEPENIAFVKEVSQTFEPCSEAPPGPNDVARAAAR